MPLRSAEVRLPSTNGAGQKYNQGFILCLKEHFNIMGKVDNTKLVDCGCNRYSGGSGEMTVSDDLTEQLSSWKKERVLNRRKQQPRVNVRVSSVPVSLIVRLSFMISVNVRLKIVAYVHSTVVSEVENYSV